MSTPAAAAEDKASVFWCRFLIHPYTLNFLNFKTRKTKMTNKEPEEFTNLASVNLVAAKTRKLLTESQDSINRLLFESNASDQDAFSCVTSLTAMVLNETSETKI